jgi:hypothetical protein
VTTAVPPPRHDCAFAGPFYRADVDSIGACYDACAIDTNCGGFSFAGLLAKTATRVPAHPGGGNCTGKIGETCCYMQAPAAIVGEAPRWNFSCWSKEAPRPPEPPAPPPSSNNCVSHFDAAACAFIRPNVVPPSTDCALRAVALELATHHRPDAAELVAKALRMALLCNTSSKVGRAADPGQGGVRTAAADHLAPSSPGAVVLVVAPDGDDANPGTEALPMKTLAAGVAKLRTIVPSDEATQTKKKTLLLRGGVYELDAPLLLGPADSGLTITTFPGDARPAQLSGARRLQHIEWHRTGSADTGGVAIFTAKGVHGEFNAVFDGATGKRQVLARTPNADPETALFPTATIQSAPADWSTVGGRPAMDTRVILDGSTAPRKREWVEWLHGRPRRRDSMSAYFEYVVGGSAARFTPPICPGPPRTCCSNNQENGNGTWYCGTPTSLRVSGAALGTAVAAALQTRASGAPLSPLLSTHAYFNFDPSGRPAGGAWYNLIFGVSALAFNKNSTRVGASFDFEFNRGGHQSAQGSESMGSYWLEGDLAFLDAPSEWWHDRESSTLYFATNGSTPPSSLALGRLPGLLRIEGTAARAVEDVAILNISFIDTATDYYPVEGFEALGGGDQSINRGGTVFAEGSERLQVSGCSFHNNGGNCLFLSGHSRDAVLSDNTFSTFGAAAMAVVGRTKLFDATSGDHPHNTSIVRNVAHGGSIYLKGFFGALVLAKQAATTVIGNVFFDLPRNAIMVRTAPFAAAPFDC